jgi:hypothetical protein
MVFDAIGLGIWRSTVPTRVGWLLYLTSFATPSTDLKLFGVQVFVMLPTVVVHLLQGTRPQSLIALGLVVGLAANLLCIVRVPALLGIGAVLAPFVALLALMLQMDQPVISIFRMSFFFPWAAGLLLLQLGRASQRRRAARPETANAH